MTTILLERANKDATMEQLQVRYAAFSDYDGVEVITKQVQKQVIGRKLLEFAIDIFHKESFDGMELQVNALNQNARLHGIQVYAVIWT